MISDPPDESTEGMMALNSTTGKDSQESITLRNLLQPLPDTQAGPPSGSPLQNHRSPENHDTHSVQLYSRPKEHAATDLDVGFSWGQPMKIDPGRFSNRPKPSNTALPNVDSSRNEPLSTAPSGPGPKPGEQTIFEDDDTIQAAESEMPTSILLLQKTVLSPIHHSHPLAPTGLSFAPDHVSDHAHQHQVVSGKTPAPSDAVAVPATRNKGPFDELQPVRRVVHQKDQLPTPTTASTMPSQVRLVESRCDEPCADTPGGCSEPKSLQQDQIHMQAPPQKPRTSFRNDISVSSDRPPKQLPQHNSTGLGTVNRPVREEQGRSSSLNTPRTRSRATPATGSNTRRKCKAQNSIASSESRFSNQYSSTQQQETPSLRPRQRSPQDQLRKMFVQKLAVHKGEVAGYLNDKWSAMEQQMDQQIHGIIADLKRKLEKQETETSRYKKHTRSKDSKIQKLEEDHERLVGMLQASEKQLQERTAKFSKLDEKCRKYKEYLNSAISEQQELYKATKAKCDGAIAQMRAEESQRQVSQERERKNAESAREHLNQIVKTTVTERKQKECELNEKIRFLSQKIEERDADLLREREVAQILQQQNVSINSVQNTLKSFGIQIEEVVTKAIEASSYQNKQDDPKSKEMHMKLDQIMGHLLALDERVCSQDNASKELQELNEKAVVSILGKLEPILESQLETKADLHHLCAGFEEYVDQLWETLENRQLVLEEHIEQRQTENEQQINILQNELEMNQQECIKQKEFAEELEAAVSERQSEIDGLLNEVADLEEAQVDGLAQSERLKRVQEEHAKLKEEATAKAANISELEAKLQKSKSAFATEGKKHQKDTEQLRKLLEKRLSEAQTNQVHAVEAAQRNAMLQMNEVKADIEKRLGQVLEERAKLQKDLEAAKQQIVAMGDDGSRSSEKIQHLEQELETSRLEAVKFKEEVSQKEAKQNTREKQSELVGDLQSQLASADRKYNKLVENAKSYDRAAHTVWQSLKRWTNDYTAIQEVRGELHETKDADLDQINPKFQPLRQIQLLQKAVERYCRTQKVAAEMLTDGNFGGSAAFNAAWQSVSRSSPPATESQETASQKPMGGILNQFRRVMIKSPASNAPSPMPPSVQIEQKRRRAAYPPKPILKLTPDAQEQEGEDEALPQGILNRWHSTGNSLRDIFQHGKPVDSASSSSNLNRGPYNRLVAGSQAPLMLPVVERGLSQNTQSSDGLTEQVENVTEKGRKRKEPHASKERETPTIKRQRANTSTPHSSSPEPDANSAPNVEHVPRAPRKAGHQLVPDRPLSSPVRSSQLSRDNHQHRTATGTGARRPSSEGRIISSKRASSLDSNKDPLSPFFLPRHSTRGNADSQDSITRSQDVDVEARSQASLYSFKRHITLGP